MSRIVATSENYEMQLVLDFNSQVYPMVQGDRFTLVLATTLDLDGRVCDGVYDSSDRATLADGYDYVMHGRVYEVLEEKAGKKAVFVSYGGMLMRLRGDERNLSAMKRGSDYYLLLRRA